MIANDPYAELERRFGRMSAVNRASAILNWDRSAMMPEGASEDRADQLATLGVISHEMMVAPDMADLLSHAEEGGTGLDAWRAANLREMRHAWTHANALPSDLVEARTRASSACEMAWREAKKKSDFKALLPTFTEVVTITRRVGEAKAAALGLSLYDALLDEYEPGGRARHVDALFATLADFLPSLVGRILDRQGPSPAAIGQPVSPAAYWLLCREMLGRLGFDFTHGRLDVSAHPFTGGTPSDVRLTTRIDGEDLLSALFHVLHEAGHGLYEQGLPAQWRRQPVGAAPSMSIHESQSLFIEMQVCRSRAFFDFATPALGRALGGSALDPDALYRAAIRVQRSPIRVEADEATYPLHVILRYDLERALLSGELATADLPGAWNEAMQKLVGIVPPDDAQGCLQDIHWFDGAIGYFPTYALGALTAAHLAEACARDLPAMGELIARGDFGPILGWLRAKVHSRGTLQRPADLVLEATGRPLDTAAFRRHLERRYLG